MIFVPFLAAHLVGFEVQEGQCETNEMLAWSGYGEFLESVPSSMTAIRSDGTVVGMGGIVPQSTNRALVWALVSKLATRYDFIEITKEVRRVLDNSGFSRVEAIVKDGFENGHRWAKILGFHCETPSPMLNWFENGGGAFLYARCK